MTARRTPQVARRRSATRRGRTKKQLDAGSKQMEKTKVCLPFLPVLRCSLYVCEVAVTGATSWACLCARRCSCCQGSRARTAYRFKQLGSACASVADKTPPCRLTPRGASARVRDTRRWPRGSPRPTRPGCASAALISVRLERVGAATGSDSACANAASPGRCAFRGTGTPTPGGPTRRVPLPRRMWRLSFCVQTKLLPHVYLCPSRAAPEFTDA